jgi:hypothetical protein
MATYSAHQLIAKENRVRRTLQAGLLFMCAAVTALGQKPASKATVIKLEPYLGNALAMHISVNGHEGLFLFDTGGGVSIITPEFAKSIGCTPWGNIAGFRMTGQRMDFPRCDNAQPSVGATPLKAATLGVFDLAGLLPKDAPRLDGSVGLDLFAGKAITFDAAGQTLTIESPDSLVARVRNAKEIPVRLVRDAGGLALEVEAGVPTDRGMAWMEVDSGNGGPFVIDNHVAALFHLDPNGKGTQTVRFELAAGIAVKGPARTADLIMDGNLGARFLRSRIITIDLGSGRAWLSPNA